MIAGDIVATVHMDDGTPVIRVGDGDSELAARLSKELTDYNAHRRAGRPR